MKVLWNFDGGIMESLWKFHGEILDWNMEKLWSICGDLTRWKIIDWKIPKTRYNGVVREPNGRIENATEDYELGN